ncbi:hypothetical protein ABPG72_005846 [Tetrahymena utriculariae]
MKSIKASFKEQEQDSLQFLEKLTKFKKASQEIKKKNQLAAHKLEWQKDMLKMNKLEKSLTNELGYICIQIDKLIGPLKLMEQFEEEKEDHNKNFFSLNEKLISQRDNLQLNVWYQVRNFRDIVQKIKSNKQIDFKTLHELYQDIKKFLLQSKEIVNQDYEILKTNKQIQMESYILDQEAIIDDIVGDKQQEFLFQNDDALSVTSTSKPKLQLLLENDNTEQDEDEIINYLKVFQGDGEVVIEEKKLLVQYKKALRLMNERYELEIQKLEVEYENKGRTEPPEFFRLNKNLEEFKHIYKCYNMKGKERDFYMERLSLHFPKVKKLVLEVMDSILQNSEYKQQKLDSLYRNYLSERRELKRKAEQQIQDMLAQKIEENRKNAEKLQTQIEQARIQEELEQKRMLFMIKKQQKLEIQRQLEEERQLEEKKKKEIYDLRCKESKQKAIEYENQKKIKEEKQRFLEEEKRKQQLQEQKEIVLKNKDKVQVRQDYELEKIQMKAYQKELIEKQKQLNEERIEQAIENYQFRPKVEADFNRLKKPTKALVIKQQTKLDKADKVELTQVHGYNVNQLMKDMRYRLSSALADAGLVHTDYARDVLKYLYN